MVNVERGLAEIIASKTSEVSHDVEPAKSSEPKSPDIFEGVQEMFDELLPQLGNAQWGEGNYHNYNLSPYTTSWKVSSRYGLLSDNKQESFSFSRFIIPDGRRSYYLYVDLPFQQRLFTEALKFHRQTDLVAKQTSVSYVGFFAVRAPFTLEVVSALVKAAAFIGPRVIDGVDPSTYTPGYASSGERYVGEGYRF